MDLSLVESQKGLTERQFEKPERTMPTYIMWFPYKAICWVSHIFFTDFSGENIETLELSEMTVNPGQMKAGPQDFELLKVLGKGGYGKVRNWIVSGPFVSWLKHDIWSGVKAWMAHTVE